MGMWNGNVEEANVLVKLVKLTTNYKKPCSLSNCGLTYVGEGR